MMVEELYALHTLKTQHNGKTLQVAQMTMDIDVSRAH